MRATTKQLIALFVVFTFGVSTGIAAMEYKAYMAYITTLEDSASCNAIEDATYNSNTGECELKWNDVPYEAEEN